mgnify:FL=1
MSVPKSRRATALSPHAALAAVLQATANLEGSAAIASAAVEGVGSTPLQREAARYTADRLLSADVRLLREAVDAMEGAMQGGAA